MGTVQRILAHKKNAIPLTTHAEELVFDAIGRMSTHGIGSLVVVEGTTVIGIIAERDYLRKVALMGRSSRTTTVAEVMSAPVLTVTPNDTIDHCMSVMTENRCRHLPVLGTQGTLVGLVSIGDCVKTLVREQADEIGHLNDYITGAPNLNR